MVGTLTQINRPVYLVFGPDGGLYFTDFSNHRIRRWDPDTKIVSTYAGTGNSTFTADGSHRTATNLQSTQSFTFAPNGDLVYGEGNHGYIRKADATTGIVTTILGDGTKESTGEGGPATSARTNGVTYILFDPDGNILFGESRSIRRIDRTTNVVTTISGDNSTGTFAGEGVDASFGRMSFPRGMAFDEAGNLFFAEEGNVRIRRIDANTNIISTVAGTGSAGYAGENVTALGAVIGQPAPLAFDTFGNLYFGTITPPRIRKIEAAGERLQRQVDNRIGKKSNQQRGGGVYNLNASGQTIRIREKKRRIRFFFSVRNAGNVPDDFIVRATKGNRFFKTKYVQSGRGNVTGAIRRQLFLNDIGAGGVTTFTATVRTTFREGSKRRNFSILSTSGSAPTIRDLVRAKLRVKLPTKR